MTRRAIDGKDYYSYKPVIDWVVADLALQDANIKYWFKPYTRIGGRATDKDSYFIVKISTNESDTYIRQTIAHELRHIWQHVNKRLIYVWNFDTHEWYRKWDGVPYSSKETDRLFNTNMGSYRALPWEKDAHEYTDRVIETLKLIPTRS